MAFSKKTERECACMCEGISLPVGIAIHLSAEMGTTASAVVLITVLVLTIGIGEDLITGNIGTALVVDSVKRSPGIAAGADLLDGLQVAEVGHGTPEDSELFRKSQHVHSQRGEFKRT
jgi:hypothetical protein